MLASELHKATVNTKPPYTVTGIIIHKLAASLFKPQGSKRGKKVAAYSPEITVYKNCSYHDLLSLSLSLQNHKVHNIKRHTMKIMSHNLSLLSLFFSLSLFTPPLSQIG